MTVESARYTHGHKGVGHGDLANRKALHRSVQGLDGKNGASNGEVVRVGDQGSSTEVGAGTDALEDGGQSDEALSDGL